MQHDYIDTEFLFDVAEKLASAFLWDATPQGFDYWHEVYENLYSLADNSPSEGVSDLE